MKPRWRGLALFALLLLIWPEAQRYRAEWWLAEANTRLERILLGQDRGPVALASVARAEALARAAADRLPADPRADLLLSVALILQARGAEAVAVLDAAIAEGERPELTLSLGRARATLKDEAGAEAAFLRTTWASEVAIVTLPKAMRLRMRARVLQWDADLRAGRVHAPPPLSSAPAARETPDAPE